MSKVLVLGLDGGSFEYMAPWLEAGYLPNLDGLINEGTTGVLRSTFLPTTAIAWPTMLTGKNPGKHGIFDFRYRRSGSYDLSPSLALGIDGDPLHVYLSRLGLRVGLVNVPMTYPPREVNGFIITGFTTPEEADNWAYPHTLAIELDKAGVPYPMPQLHELIQMKNKRGHGAAIQEYINRWDSFTKAQTETICYLLEQRPYDFFMLVFSSTDHINHHTPNLNYIRRIYEQVDAAIGQILSVVDEETTILVVSDHGSASLKRYIVLNRFLADEGLIAFKSEIAIQHIKSVAGRYVWEHQDRIGALWSRLPAFLRRFLSWPWLQLDERLRFGYENIDWQRTYAYAFSGIGSLFINLEGREPQGIVKPGKEYAQLREQIINGLLSLRDETGQPLIKEAHKAEAVFHGSYMIHAPDILFSRYCETDRAVTGFATDPIVRSSIRPDGTSAEYGYHTSKGILIARGPGLKKGTQIKRADIHDIAPTVLHLLGKAVPTDMDGGVLQDLFTEPMAVTMIERETTENKNQHALSQTATDDFEERLRLLGYLD